jgi:VWD domain-containing protein
MHEIEVRGDLVAKQIRKHFALTCALLGRRVKSGAMFTIVALSFAWSATGAAAASGFAQQPQDKPTTAEQERAKPITDQAEAWRLATQVERETWRKTILKTPRPTKEGVCYEATYPETQWREAPCKPPLTKVYPPRRPGHAIRVDRVGGNSGTDFSPEVTGDITESEGSFDPGTTVGSECAVQCPSGTCPATPSCTGNPANTYSLQLNTVPFTDTAAGSPCSHSPNPSDCQEWEQFVYPSSGGGGIQYWLETYGPSGTLCPTPRGASCVQGFSSTDGWCPFSFTTGGEVYCVVNAPGSTTAAAVPASSLEELKVTGAVAGVDGNPLDSLAITVGSTVSPMNGSNYFPNLSSHWQIAEFNVFGDGGGDQAVFSSGTTIVVRAGVDSGTTNGPLCDAASFTGESNNLTLENSPPSAMKGSMPALVFSESFPAPSGAVATCVDATSVGDTHLTTFDGVYYDFQATGDFVLMQDGSEFEVQTRQQTGPPQYPNTAVNKGVAVRMGKSQVAIYIEPTRLVIDGAANNLADGKTIQLPTGVQITRDGGAYMVTSADGDSVVVTLEPQWIDVSVGLGHATATKTRGLLGSSNGNGQAIETARGVVLKEPVAFTDLYHTYADSWRVDPKDSLFTDPTSINVGIPAKTFFASDLDPKVAANARTACQAAGVTAKDLLESCTLDTAVLNNKAAAKVFVRAPIPLHVIKPVFTLKPLAK